ncbi:hypothetical protein ACVWY2_003446 [Bradyrhizobium sp. JR6.1]
MSDMSCDRRARDTLGTAGAAPAGRQGADRQQVVRGNDRSHLMQLADEMHRRQRAAFARVSRGFTYDPVNPCRAIARQRLSSFSKAFSSTSSFFEGWRSTPGTIPATSQLDRLISITAISVPSGLRGVKGSAQVVQLLHGGLHRFTSAPMNAIFLPSSPPPSAA